MSIFESIFKKKVKTVRELIEDDIKDLSKKLEKEMTVNIKSLNQLDDKVLEAILTWLRKEYALKEARELFNENKFEEAILKYNIILEKEPKELDALANKGLALKKLGQFEEALECYEKFLKIDSNDFDALLGKAIVLKNLKRYKDAIRIYDGLLKKDPKNFSVWANKGSALNDMGEFKQALKCVNEALKIDPLNKEVQNWKWDAVEKLLKQEDKSGKKYEFDHIVAQFRPNSNIKHEAEMFVKRVKESLKGLSDEIRINPAYQDDEFHQVIEAKTKTGWLPVYELIKCQQ